MTAMELEDLDLITALSLPAVRAHLYLSLPTHQLLLGVNSDLPGSNVCFKSTCPMQNIPVPSLGGPSPDLNSMPDQFFGHFVGHFLGVFLKAGSPPPLVVSK